jgi:hypothetical protein
LFAAAQFDPLRGTSVHLQVNLRLTFYSTGPDGGLSGWRNQRPAIEKIVILVSAEFRKSVMLNEAKDLHRDAICCASNNPLQHAQSRTNPATPSFANGVLGTPVFAFWGGKQRAGTTTASLEQKSPS